MVGFRISGNLTSNQFQRDEIFYTHSGSHVGCGETLNITCDECTHAYARYVYVWIPVRQRFLTMCEFEVYTGGKHF